MKELKDVLEIVAEGLKSFSGSIGTLAGMINDVAAKIKVDEPDLKDPVEQEEIIPPPAQKIKKDMSKKAVGRPATKKKSSGKSNVLMKGTAADVVLGLIRQTEEGLNANEVEAKTGYDRKKISNIFYRLKKSEKIRNDEKGVYYFIDTQSDDKNLLQAK